MGLHAELSGKLGQVLFDMRAGGELVVTQGNETLRRQCSQSFPLPFVPGRAGEHQFLSVGPLPATKNDRRTGLGSFWPR